MRFQCPTCGCVRNEKKSSVPKPPKSEFHTDCGRCGHVVAKSFTNERGVCHTCDPPRGGASERSRKEDISEGL